MKITFIKDCPAIIQSGNSVYAKGVKADLRKGQELIDLGYAHKGWGEAQIEDEKEPEIVTFDYENMPDESLKRLAKEYGIKGYTKMKRETLIQRLIDGD